MSGKRALAGFVHQKVFDAIYSRALIYNTCWEDPAVDREALGFHSDDIVLAITSAGCNVLDYALAGPLRIHAVDANPRQTALLELKLAAIRRLHFEDFFAIFGEGAHPAFRELYGDVLRADLSPFAANYWDKNGWWFVRSRNQAGFYSYSLSGRVARAFRGYLDLRPRLRFAIEDLFSAKDLEQQKQIYDARIAPIMWGNTLNWVLSRQITMSLLGVPHSQHEEVRRQHAGGVPGFVREAIEYVFRCLPVWTNYFWNLYVRGTYSATCCPEYLKRENFYLLKGGRSERIVPHTCSVTAFLHTTEERISKFVLLDHMDWMACVSPAALAEEWAAIFSRATPNARIIFRSAHADPAYLKVIQVQAAGRQHRLNDVLAFHPQLAQELTRHDRVHTYAGFHIADVTA